jgi:hypothetical protein
MSHRLCSFVITAILLLTQLAIHGQEVSAGITGRVIDPSGAAIAGALVNAKDQQRGTEWPTTTNEEGVYAFPRIPIGTYSLRVEAAGFKTALQSDITLEVNQRARLDVTMQVGGVAETVEVSGAAPLLQTETTQVGSVISSQTIVNTPLISRNPIALTLLAPGVTTPNPSGFNNGVRTTGGGRPYVNGNREEANNFLLDGIDNQPDVRQSQFLSAERRCDPGIQDDHEQRLGRVREFPGRHHQRDHQVRNKPMAWQRFRVLPERQAECEQLGQ